MLYTSKDKLFIALVVILAFFAGVGLMTAISEFQEQETMQAVESVLSQPKTQR